jgi:hypothetical protein
MKRLHESVRPLPAHEATAVLLAMTEMLGYRIGMRRVAGAIEISVHAPADATSQIQTFVVRTRAKCAERAILFAVRELADVIAASIEPERRS